MRDPNQYARFSDERSRPFFNLLERVPDRPFREIVDLGCGSGVLTQALSDRWQEAHVVGLDASPEMLAASEKFARPGRLEFVLGDIAAYDKSTDLIFTNAALQWLPDHETLLPRLAALVKPGGVFACQLPSTFTEPSHRHMTETARNGPWAPKLADWQQLAVMPIEWYLEQLLTLGFTVDAWETTYQFILSGEDPVYEWVKGTSLQPILSRLDEGEREAFRDAYSARLRDAYPTREYGTIYPFRRLFFVASRD
jgi:trans-aconitate 2-methyltransferase